MDIFLLRVALILCLLFSALPAAAQTITGVASVTDGDSLEIRGIRIRLHGIDAPESRQLCTRPSGETWRCGQQAALALSDRIGRRSVSCESLDTDRYGRTIAVCLQDGVDLNAWMVREGWAAAYRQYSRDYVLAEADARRAGRNIWSGTFVMPWDWRRGARSP
jgi:endonuclease YncB( thermonuclease family)